ncbi:MAG: hypothetical protein ACR2KZ_01055 [Segetibacter sp.]
MFTELLKKIFDDEFFIKLKEQQKRIDELTGLMSKAMKELSLHGWYISGKSEVATIINLMDNLKKPDIEKVDETMKLHYDSNFDTIMADLNNLFPERKEIFTQAAKCHKLEIYYASISLFLSQSDGICKGYLFILKNEKKNLKKEISKFNNSALEEFLEVIMNESTIEAPYSNGTKYPSK